MRIPTGTDAAPAPARRGRVAAGVAGLSVTTAVVLAAASMLTSLSTGEQPTSAASLVAAPSLPPAEAQTAAPAPWTPPGWAPNPGSRPVRTPAPAPAPAPTASRYGVASPTPSAPVYLGGSGLSDAALSRLVEQAFPPPQRARAELAARCSSGARARRVTPPQASGGQRFGLFALPASVLPALAADVPTPAGATLAQAALDPAWNARAAAAWVARAGWSAWPCAPKPDPAARPTVAPAPSASAGPSATPRASPTPATG